MVRPVRQRTSEPQMVQKIWNAISYIRQQKQISNRERITRYMEREHDLNVSEIHRQLENAVKDTLVDSYIAVGFKGSKVGVEQEGFKIPEPYEEVDDKGSHDWYCFQCHNPGDVLLCSECWRVYHVACSQDETSGSKFTCSICKAGRRKQRIRRKELNRLLSFTVSRLKEKTRELHKLGAKEEEERFSRLMYLPMDLNTMEAKCKARKYKYLEHFHADAQAIYHNVFICYGGEKTGQSKPSDPSGMAELARIMIRDCVYDLEEIRRCKDCYHYSNMKPKDWFCQPCRPPHELVYAKQKGFTYWPAKVIKVSKEGYDVRFFGGWHQRAVIARTSIKPIDTSLRSLSIKRTAGFVKACEELCKHQKLLEQMSEPEGTETEDLEEEEEEAPRKKSHIEKPHHTEKPKTYSIQQQDSERDTSTDVISSTNIIPDKPAATPEDVNLVTSSEDNVQSPRIISTADIGTQTSKKLSHPGRQPHKWTQTDLEIASGSCDCDTKYNKIFNDFKHRLENDHQEDKDRALKELAERLQKDFEEDKQQAVSRAMNNLQREVERIRRQTEERCAEKYGEDVKKLATKHKAEISATKKKQWCFNCEEEAMYHCCWNTSYCSVKCQQEHWHSEHKRICRRKR